ncbi:UvrD-helicase domain-containing protein [Streptomyces deserti]
MTGRPLDTLTAVIEELEAGRSFLLEAGAGAGKTTTLVRALQHLLSHRRTELEASGRRIACITYTNVAKKKIVERISADPLSAPSTNSSGALSRPIRVSSGSRSSTTTRDCRSQKISTR